MKKVHFWLLLVSSLLSELALAQFMRPPAFAGGIPGRASFQAVLTQRHQARTLLYREALEELRRNPQAADLPVCSDAAQGACLTAPAVSPASTFPESTSGRRLALLVGNNRYATPIPPLETPIADVTKIASILTQQFGFETRIIKDAGQAQIIDAVNRIATEVRPEDSVVLFYAGHGYLMEDLQMGFWIPVDASVKTAKGWISNSDISKLLAAIPARQLILISDSCFSGTLTREGKVPEVDVTRPGDISQRRSVVVMSSGGDEPVSDEGKDGHSVFAWNLIRTLENTGSITPGLRVWSNLHRSVMQDFPQEPQYGAVVSAGHVAGGDFLFLPR